MPGADASIVSDSDDLVTRPEAMAAYCVAVGLTFIPEALACTSAVLRAVLRRAAGRLLAGSPAVEQVIGPFYMWMHQS